MASNSQPVKTIYTPTPEESQARSTLYKNLALMRELKDKQMPHFSGPDGERSFNQYLDDAEKLVNVYTLSREDQGKDDWQSNANVGAVEVRAKMRAIAAGVGLKVPGMTFEAIDGNGIRSAKRAEIFKNIVKQTYSNENPSLSAFLETWHLLSHGVAFEYEGYKTGGAMQQVVDSFDSRTGEVKVKQQYVKFDGTPFNVLINPQEFYWWTFFVRDVQKQPRVAWVQHYTKREIEAEFSKYPNYKYVKDRAQATQLQLQDSLFMAAWGERVNQDGNDYEVVRMLSKEDDNGNPKKGELTGYEVWINGVPILRCPLLWGEKDKRYPFAKQVPEYFANTNFFVGVPFAILLEGYEDNKNMLINSLVDKVARGLNPMKLVGLQNRDLLDVESEIQTIDSTVYVPDIEAVKFMDYPTVNQGELVLLQALNQGIELVSIDRSQQGVASGSQKTAHEAVIADQRARELKGNLYLSLEDLWFQKTKLRVEIVLTHYLKDKAAADTIKGQIISIKDYSFGDGSRGILDIHIAKSNAKLLSLHEIEARELAMKQQGINYKLVSMLKTYLDDWEYDFHILPESFHQQDVAARQDQFDSEVQWIVTLDPEFFVANKDKYLAEKLSFRGKSLEEFEQPKPPAPAPAAPGQPGAPAPAGPGGAPIAPQTLQGERAPAPSILGL